MIINFTSLKKSSSGLFQFKKQPQAIQPYRSPFTTQSTTPSSTISFKGLKSSFTQSKPATPLTNTEILSLGLGPINPANIDNKLA